MQEDDLTFHIPRPPEPQPPQEPPAEPTEERGDEAAASFARTKVGAIYRAETALQDEVQPQYHHVDPSHQLPSHEMQASRPPLRPPLPVSYSDHILPPALMVDQAAPTSRAEQIKQFASGAARQGKAMVRKGRVMRPLVRSALLTALVFLIYNAPIVTGQLYYYITPANTDPTPIILDDTAGAPVSNDPKIIISKLNIDVPTVYDETSYEESKVQEALKRGIVHYGTTALPGQLGNAVFLGHSSNSPWDPGRYKTAFSILRRLEVGDTFVLHFQGQRYIYEVFEKHITDPGDFSVIDQNVSEPIVTLITCDPPGANWKRLIIVARQISPDPSQSQPPSASDVPSAPAEALPGSPPSLLDRIRNIF